MAKKQIKVTQVKSVIGRHFKQKRTMTALGLRCIRDSVVHDDTPQIQGMIAKVSHLVETESVS